VINLSLKSIITRTLAPQLNEYGFTYADGQQTPNLWTFIRTKNGRQQFIAIQKSNHVLNALRIQFSTEKANTMVYGNHLVKSDEKENHWDTYTTDNDIVSVLQKFLDIALSHGISYLDQAIMPDLYATVDMERELLTTYPSEALEFTRIYNINVQHENAIKEMENILIRDKQELKNENWKLMLMASAFLGEYVRFRLGGEWAFDERLKASAITNIHGKTMLRIHPLRWVSNFWAKPEIKFLKPSYLFQGFKELL
jgi:hypothetical protein